MGPLSCSKGPTNKRLARRRLAWEAVFLFAHGGRSRRMELGESAASKKRLGERSLAKRARWNALGPVGGEQKWASRRALGRRLIDLFGQRGPLCSTWSAAGLLAAFCWRVGGHTNWAQQAAARQQSAAAGRRFQEMGRPSGWRVALFHSAPLRAQTDALWGSSSEREGEKAPPTELVVAPMDCPLLPVCVE